MRDALGPGTILGYCTNVHAGTTLDEITANLREHAVGVRERLGVDELGIGIWLPTDALERVFTDGQPADSVTLWADAASLGLHPFTVNAFPFGNFHGASVKHRVYEPDWNHGARWTYTRAVSRMLAAQHVSETRSISTLPLGWRSTRRDWAHGFLIDMAIELARHEQDSGQLIHVDLEPEPGCELDTAADVTSFFQDYLQPAAATREPSMDITRYLRVCHDVCHSAVMGEDQADVLRTYRDAGIKVGKVQVSNAVEVDFDAMQPSERPAAIAELAAFSEDRYLHQTMVRSDDGTQTFYEDLPLALRAAEQAGEAHGRWRVHFHVPLHVERFGRIGTTQREIGACMDAIEPGDGIEHFETETYAWGVLPEAMRVDTLADGIAAELRWLVETHGR